MLKQGLSDRALLTDQLDQLRRLNEKSRILAETLAASIEGMIQIEGRLRLFDEILPKLVEQAQQEALIRRAFEPYLPPHLVHELVTDPGRVNLNGELRRVTILFADFRQFTETVARRHPHDVLRVLNSYFTQMAAIVAKHNGSIDKFLGDGFMAVFDAPVPFESSPLQATQASLEIQQYLTMNGRENSGPAEFRLPMGIGINEGDAVVGSLGSPERMDYTAIGDTVNIAARLTGIAEPGQVILGFSAARAVRSKVRVMPLPLTKLKGRSKPIRPYLALPDES